MTMNPTSTRIIPRLCAAALLACAATLAQADVVAVKAARILTGTGKVIDNGVVLIENGRIIGIGPGLTIPEGAKTIDAGPGTITPGLVDAHALIEPRDPYADQVAAPSQRGRPRGRNFASLGSPELSHTPPDDTTGLSPLRALFANCNTDMDCSLCSGFMPCVLAASHSQLAAGEGCPCCAWQVPSIQMLAIGVNPGSASVESSSEVVPHTLVLDSLNLWSPDFKRLAMGGVTTVFASGESSAVIGPQGAVVRTGGPMSGRVLKEASDIKMAMGRDSYRTGAGNLPPFRGFVSSNTRRPTTRMGVVWVARKAMHDAARFAQGVHRYGADTPSDEALAVLAQVLDGKVALRIQARPRHDILTALRLADELGTKFTLVEGTEAHDCLDHITAAGIPVIYGPVDEQVRGPRRSASIGEQLQPRLDTASRLIARGVVTALSAQDLRDDDGLSRQALYAMRGGLDEQAALQAVTLTPARLIGVDHEVGSIEAGKRADLVIWNGPAFAATSKAVVVIIDGQIVYDARPARR